VSTILALTALLSLQAAGGASSLADAQTAGAPHPVIAAIHVQGNQLTTDDDILELAAVRPGAAYTPTTIAEVTARLRQSGHFRDVEVRERFDSISDLSQIALVIIVDEGPVSVARPDRAGGEVHVVRRRGLTDLMVLPLLSAEDGYGLTYGARLAYVRIGGAAGRLSFPLTWGGDKHGGIEYERTFRAGPVSRVLVATALDRRRNPAFDVDDDRRQVWARIERGWRAVRIGGQIESDGVTFAGAHDRVTSAGLDATFDTRLDPVLPRTAVVLHAAATAQNVESAGRLTRHSLDGRGYLGLVGQTVLVGRVTRDDASGALPPFLATLVGGWSTLRGFRAGAFHGDTALTGSIELRVPVNSALQLAKVGVSVFVDSGTAYDKGARLRTAPLHTGIGGGVWVAAAALRLGVSVAHGRGASTRANFGATLSF
jgi:outer membrane protein assembly factor BamA